MYNTIEEIGILNPQCKSVCSRDSTTGFGVGLLGEDALQESFDVCTVLTFVRRRRVAQMMMLLVVLLLLCVCFVPSECQMN